MTADRAMHGVTDRQTDDIIMPISDHTAVRSAGIRESQKGDIILWSIFSSHIAQFWKFCHWHQ